MNFPRPAALVLLAFALALSAAGCGSDSSSSTPTEGMSSSATADSTGSATNAKGGSGGTKDGGSNGASTASKPQSKPPPEPKFFPRVHHDSGGGSSQFRVKGGDNSIEEYGGESSGSEFEEASAALHDYLDARAAGAWAAACEYLAAGVALQLAQLTETQGGEGSGCRQALASISLELAPGVLREAAVADVASLRTEGDSGFLLFNGAHGVDYFVPVAREDGAWKVAAPVPSALP